MSKFWYSPVRDYGFIQLKGLDMAWLQGFDFALLSSVTYSQVAVINGCLKSKVTPACHLRYTSTHRLNHESVRCASALRGLSLFVHAMPSMP